MLSSLFDTRVWLVSPTGTILPSNAAELFACNDIDGGLVGGASLKAADFYAIAQAASGIGLI